VRGAVRSDMDKTNFVHDKSPQEFFDAFNTFIMSADKKVFEKLISKNYFLDLTKHIPGDVVELGVFRGSGIFGWLKMLSYLGLNRRVYGFDIFDSELLLSSITTQDRNIMSSLFEDRGFDPLGYEELLRARIANSGFSNFDLVSGDVFNSIPNFLESNPGFRASVINFDLDTEEPTYFALTHMWERLVIGGVLVFDEYAINEWTESSAVDRFVKEKGLRLQSTNIYSPSAYVLKT
jgi:hypothetical protein